MKTNVESEHRMTEHDDALERLRLDMAGRQDGASAAQVLSVPCPKCGAEPGQRCRKSKLTHEMRLRKLRKVERLVQRSDGDVLKAVTHDRY
jgi:hypothetical protein